MPTFSVQIDDHCCHKTTILDDAYHSIIDAMNAAKEFLTEI